MEPGAELPIARLGFELLKPIPLAPLTLTTRIVRKGRRVQELAAELTTASGGGAPDHDEEAGEDLVCRASALRIQPVPGDLPNSGSTPPEKMPGPEHGKAIEFALNRAAGTSLATSGMEMSWLTDPWDQGPGKVWMRLRHPLLPDEPDDIADAAGRDRRLRQRRQRGAAVRGVPVHQRRPDDPPLASPRGEWIGLDAHTLLQAAGSARPRACCTTSTARSAAPFRRWSCSRAEILLPLTVERSSQARSGSAGTPGNGSVRSASA